MPRSRLEWICFAVGVLGVAALIGWDVRSSHQPRPQNRPHVAAFTTTISATSPAGRRAERRTRAGYRPPTELWKAFPLEH
jgi:hypothetical protein